MLIARASFLCYNKDAYGRRLSICPGVGTAVGFVVGGVVCIVVDIFAGNWFKEMTDEIAK